MWSNSDDEEIKKILGPSISLGFPGGSSGKESACNVGDLGLIPGLGRSPGGDPLEEGMAIHSSILAWRIPWTKESGRLQSMGSQRVGQDWATKHTSSISLEKTHFVPFYGWVIFHCVCGGCVCVCVCDIFFIQSSVDGHLRCFHVLAIVDSAALNLGMHVSFGSMIFSGYMPRSGIAGSHAGPLKKRNLHKSPKKRCSFSLSYIMSVLITLNCHLTTILKMKLSPSLVDWKKCQTLGCWLSKSSNSKAYTHLELLLMSEHKF